MSVWWQHDRVGESAAGHRQPVQGGSDGGDRDQPTDMAERIATDINQVNFAMWKMQCDH